MEIDVPEPDVKPHVDTVCPETVVTQSSGIKEEVSSKKNKVTRKSLKKFQCSQCLTSKQPTKVFSTKRSLYSHIIDIHREPRFKCQVCFKAFTRITTFKRHKQTHSLTTLENKIECNLCPATFQTKQNLERHLFHTHEKKIEGVNYFKCEFCPLEFVNKYKMKRHVMGRHSVDRASNFKCSVCSKTFIDQATLDKHMTEHDKRQSYICDICSKEYQRNNNLKNHLMVKHAKFYQCCKCWRSFGNSREFDDHLDSETGPKLKCEICCEMFNSQCNLDIHTNSHLNEIKIKQEPEINSSLPKDQTDDKVESTLTQKPTQELQCDLCLQTFDRESHFKQHRILVHPKSIWACNFEHCSKPFKHYSEYIRHKVTHSAGRS